MIRQRGVTLIELMIAMSLAAVMSAFMLMLTRSQLIAYETSDQITRTQQNARAGIDFLELRLRRACTGSSLGRFVVVSNTIAGKTAGTVLPCVRYYNSAGIGATGSFTDGTDSGSADAIEVLSGDAPIMQADKTKQNPAGSFSSLTGTPASIVAKTTTLYDLVTNPPFKHNDLVLVSTYYDAFIYQIDTVAAVNGDLYSWTLNFTSSASPDNILTAPTAIGTPSVNEQLITSTAQPNLLVMKLQSFSVYLEATDPVYKNMLIFDPDGVLGTAHDLRSGTDATPLVDGVEDFQLALGFDGPPNADGFVTDLPGPDEYINGVTNLNEVTSFQTTHLPTAAQGWTNNMRTIRATLLLKTINTYPGTPNLPQSPIEDRSTWSVGNVGQTPVSGPKLRIIRMLVAPRIWNLLN